MKEIFAPHLQRKVRLGRNRPAAHCPRMKLKRYLAAPASLPIPPPSCDYTSAAQLVLSKLFLNDKLGDCVIAAGYHLVGLETANAGKVFVASDRQIVDDYSSIGGYVPGDPSTDQGCDEETAVNYWTCKGFANGTTLQGWLEVDATDENEIRTAMWLFENLLFGVELPDAWIDPFPGPDFVWTSASPDPANGHAFVGVGYDSLGVKVDTWGMVGTVTWAAVARLCLPPGGQLLTVLSPDQIGRGQTRAPNGFDWARLVEDFHALNG